MKKSLSVFLCVFAALFFGSCSDLSVTEEAVLKVDLPADFDWQEYGKINGDVKTSQIVLDLKKTRTGDGDIANCVSVLSDMDFAKKIFSDYLQCPVDGWGQEEKCPGIYANNSNYNKTGLTFVPKLVCRTIIGTDGEPLPADAPEYDNCVKDSLILVREQAECVIGACFLGGWGGEKGLVNFLPDSLAKYSDTKSTNLGTIKAMCQFVPESSTSTQAENYLENFPFDQHLVEQHYLLFGRSDGRPYKYCADVHNDEERQQEKHAEGRGAYYASENRYAYYDYGRYTFCLDKNNQKIYVVK